MLLVQDHQILTLNGIFYGLTCNSMESSFNEPIESNSFISCYCYDKYRSFLYEIQISHRFYRYSDKVPASLMNTDRRESPCNPNVSWWDSGSATGRFVARFSLCRDAKQVFNDEWWIPFAAQFRVSFCLPVGERLFGHRLLLFSCLFGLAAFARAVLCNSPWKIIQLSFAPYIPIQRLPVHGNVSQVSFKVKTNKSRPENVTPYSVQVNIE